MKTRLFTCAAVAAALVVGGIGSASAESPAEFYKGKTLKIIIGYSMGGTYGKYAQTLAEYMAPYLGAQKIIVESRPGAGGMNATNYVYNVALKDGSVLIEPPDTLVISQLLRPKAVKYKSQNFTWLGAIVQSNSVIAVRDNANIDKISDIKHKQVIMASTGTGSQTFLMPKLANAVYGAKFKIVMGYKGSRGSQLAMERGEAHGVSLTWLSWKSAHEDWFKSGFAKPILQVGTKKEADLPNVPMLSDLVSGDNLKIVNFMATMGPIGRGLAVPPGVPKDRVDFLRAAFKKAVNDPNLKAEAVKRKLRVTPASGEEIQQVVEESLKISDKTVERARKMIFGDNS